MTPVFHWLFRLVLAMFFIAATGCATFQPVPMDQVPFKQRAVSQSDGDVTVTVVALAPEEARQVFGVDVAMRDIQPVWIEIENRAENPRWVFPSHTDPDYYSPAEVAYMNRVFGSADDNNRIRAFFDDINLSWIVPPGRTVSGFIHTTLDPGFKYVNVSLWSFEGMQYFHFLVEVPGIKADYQEVNLEKLYPPEGYVDCDEQQLRAELEKLPCCTTDREGKREGDPLNLVLIGDVVDLLTALVGSGWDVTEKLSSGSVWRTVRSFLFGKRYRHSPVSSLYAFGRPQEAAFQKARKTVSERNHLRVWLTPLRFEGRPVWIGQISRDIGVKLTLATGFLITHVIDPDVDNDRFYLIQNIADAKALARLGHVKGVGPSPPEDPRFNLGRDPYYTDGLRAVLQCSKKPTEFSRIRFFNWEWRPQAEPYVRDQNQKAANREKE